MSDTFKVLWPDGHESEEVNRATISQWLRERSIKDTTLVYASALQRWMTVCEALLLGAETTKVGRETRPLPDRDGSRPTASRHDAQNRPGSGVGASPTSAIDGARVTTGRGEPRTPTSGAQGRGLGEWYYIGQVGSERTSVGPVSELELRAAFSSGQLPMGTPVWKPGLAGWLSWSDVQGQFQPAQPKPATTEPLVELSAGGPTIRSSLHPDGRTVTPITSKMMLKPLLVGGGTILGIFIVDFLFGFTFRREIEGFIGFHYVVLALLAAGFGAMTWQDSDKGVVSLLVALAGLTLARASLAALVYHVPPDVPIRISLEEAAIVGAVGLFCGFVIRHVSLRLTFARAEDVRMNVIDATTGKKADVGTCSKCGKDTVVAIVRTLSFPGSKREKFYCQHCKAFIKGNPAVSACVGIAEIGISILGVLLATAFEPRTGSTPGTGGAVFMWIALVGFVDAVRRFGTGFSATVRGLRASKR